MNNQHDEWVRLYGSGWRFPLRFELKPSVSEDNDALLSPPPSSVTMSAGERNVAQSLALLFRTQPGERIMRPAYGCDMQSAMFANLSEGTLAALRHRIAESVARHEPRAEEVTIDMLEDQRLRGLLRITVRYRLAGQEQRVTGQLNMLEGIEGGAAWAMS